jgi:hypothetical protein
MASLSLATTLNVARRLMLRHNIPNGSSEQSRSAQVNPKIVIKSELEQVHCDGGYKPEEEWAITASAASASK